MSQQFNIQPEQILKVLRDLYAEGSDIQHIFNLLDSLQNANQRITSSAKQVWYATRNNRFLNSVVTASDLRVVYKEDFSPAVEKSMYDPFLDFETLVPVARIRLAFDISGLDFVDFTCDMNNLKTLMHSLELTYKQLEMLQELAGTLERETKNEQPDS